MEVRVGVVVRGRGAAGGAPAARAASSALRRPCRVATACAAPAAAVRPASCPRPLQSNFSRAACLADTLSGAAAGAVPLPPLLRSCLVAAAAPLATACRARRSAKSSSSFWLRMFSRASQLACVGYER